MPERKQSERTHHNAERRSGRGSEVSAASSNDADYPPHVLREYALLADGERGVLVGPRGDFSWMCVPRWDSDAVFSSLVGGGGVYAVTPREPRYVWGGYYEAGSLIWRSRWRTTTGVLESRDALAFPGERDRAVALRRVCAAPAGGAARVVLDPRAGFGESPMTRLRLEDGCWSARSGPLYIRWSGAERAVRREDGALELDLELATGEVHDLVLEIATSPLGDPVDAATLWDATEQAWRRAVSPLRVNVARRDAEHAYVVMRGLTAGSGAMVAAATMSLPERAETGRNYDYRYAWIRDQCYAGQAAAAAAAYPLLDDATRFVAARVLEDGPKLKPAYTVEGGAVPDQRSLGLTGYPGGSDMIGNWVNKQFQLDAFGEALQLLAAAARLDRLDGDGRRAMEAAVEAVGQRWQEEDAGIWELGDRVWTHSRLSCVAGLRQAAASAPPPDAAAWSSLADTILADTGRRCIHPSGRWQRSPDDEKVDAALLLPPVRGALPAEDPRTRETLLAVRRELSHDGYVYRFRHDERALNEGEGAFLLCGFMMALATHQQGDHAGATAWFERTRGSCGPPRLFAEEYDVVQSQLRGNLPQAFVHALLLECAATLTSQWGEE